MNQIKIGKYIAESLIFTAVCFGLGLILAYAFTPVMNSLLNNPSIPISIQGSPNYLIVYLLVVAIVGTLNGIIPARCSSSSKMHWQFSLSRWRL